ncbi:glycosyltransferase family 2 protein [Lapillicoccus sp.]|uniref:glycosyltransferase family 2 protein n=1 Tax=Lapillicoccus sp. TaxID=1909287 RepID=UPI0032668D23
MSEIHPGRVLRTDDRVLGHVPVSAATTPGKTIELTVVLPCLNEAETLAVCIRKATESMHQLGVVGEVVVADNGSTDGSQEIAEQEGARLVPIARRGYGAALRGGIAAAEGTYVLMADADDSYALDDIGPFLDALRSGADLAMGNRFAGGIAPGAMPWLHRYLGNPVLSRLGRVLFRAPINDFHCGMRAFRRAEVLELGMRTDGMEFASEMVVRASLSDMCIVEVPTTLRPDGRSRPPHLRTWRDGWRHLRFLLALSPRWLMVFPGAVLTLLGLVGMVWLSFGTLRVGQVSFSIQTMLVCATAVVMGTQAMGLATVARSYATHLGLLPAHAGLERALQRVTLERGVVAGVLSILLGAAAFVAAFFHWTSVDFGSLDPQSSLRLPMWGMVMVVSGLQLVMVSFTMSLTQIGTEQPESH